MEDAGKSAEGAVLLYDGVCALCNKLVSFVIRRDARGLFRYASLQSPLGQRYLVAAGLLNDERNTFVYVENDRFFTKSTAALEVLRRLDRFWPMMYLFIVIPTALRNVLYDLIARHRYGWFGKFDTCRMPDTDMKARILS